MTGSLRDGRWPRSEFTLKRLLLLAVGSVLVWGCRLGSDPAPEVEPFEPPNILLISVDTLRADHLSSYGYPRPTSPFMDQLGSMGTRFTLAFVGTHGTPPSHTSLFTSLSQQTHRVGLVLPGQKEKRNDVAPEGLVTLAEVLSAAGYRTLGVTGGGYMGRKFGLHQGFERFFDRDKGIESQTAKLLDELQPRDEADDRPVFAFLHTYEVHSPYSSPKAYEGLFGEFDSDFEPTNDNLIPIQKGASEHLSEEDFASIEAAYDRGIRYTDDVLRRTWSRLEDSGFLENTIVVLTSDHGEEFGEHGGVLHPATLFEELIHVPLVLVGDEIPAGVSDPRLVSSLDVAPTILSLAGVDVPDSMQGRNLMDPSLEWGPEDAVFSQYGGILYSMRTSRWKWIQRRNGTGKLFDLKKDPGELVNVAKSYPDQARTMASRMNQWIEGQPLLGDLDRTQVDLDGEEEDRLRALGYL